MYLRTASAVLLAAALAGCGAATSERSGEPGAVGDPDRGEQLFVANCAQCHGDGALGSDQGPPLVHEYYVPSHHSDASFQAAVERGVVPHHWGFGAMPRIEGVDPEEVADIVAYVRSLQRQAGIIE
jgi:mono/diheme cytochrome c family protein